MSHDYHRIAQSIADDLCRGNPPAVEGRPADIADTVAEALRENFAEEAAIGEEARRTLAAMKVPAGMDRSVLAAGIRDRIAKKRGFVL